MQHPIFAPMNPQPFTLHQQATGGASPAPLAGAVVGSLPMSTTPQHMVPQQQQQQVQQHQMHQAAVGGPSFMMPQPQQPQAFPTLHSLQQPQFQQHQQQIMMPAHQNLILGGAQPRRDSAFSNTSDIGGDSSSSPFAAPGSFLPKGPNSFAFGAPATHRDSIVSTGSDVSPTASSAMNFGHHLPQQQQQQLLGLLPSGIAPQTQAFNPMATHAPPVGSTGMPLVFSTPSMGTTYAQPAMVTPPSTFVNPGPSSASPGGSSLPTAQLQSLQHLAPPPPPPANVPQSGARRGSTGAMGVPAPVTAAGSQPLGSLVLNSMKVYIRHVGSSTNEVDIRKFASCFGNIRRVEKQRERGGTTFCCYITFETALSAQNCTTSGNGSMYFANLCAERGESAHLPPLSIRMAESLEERQGRINRRGSAGASPTTTSAVAANTTSGSSTPAGASSDVPTGPPPPPYNPGGAPPTSTGGIPTMMMTTTTTTTTQPQQHLMQPLQLQQQQQQVTSTAGAAAMSPMVNSGIPSPNATANNGNTGLVYVMMPPQQQQQQVAPPPGSPNSSQITSGSL